MKTFKIAVVAVALLSAMAWAKCEGEHARYEVAKSRYQDAYAYARNLNNDNSNESMRSRATSDRNNKEREMRRAESDLLDCQDPSRIKKREAEWKKEEAEKKKKEAEHMKKVLATVKKGSFTDTRDNRTYKTVKIGEQTWMAENLNYDAEDSKCYGDDPANCKKYGKLYDWETAMAVCPSGWHLPNEEEWKKLMETITVDKYVVLRSIVNLGGTLSSEDTKKLKAKSGWNNSKYGESYNGTDALGFSALPGGGYYPVSNLNSSKDETKFNAVGDRGYWWSAEKSGNTGYYLSIGGYSVYWDRDRNSGSSSLFSVRCLQNSAEQNKVIAEEAERKAAEEAAKVAAKEAASGSFTDSRDKKTYKTVKIGSQTWMAENLNYNASGSECYNNDPANCEKYGKLYDWNTAMKACPSDWHLPTEEEWDTLKAMGGQGKIGNLLKAESGWYNYGNGTDEYGFSALPGGYGSSNGTFNDVGNGGYWWSSSDSGSGSSAAYYWYIYFANSDVVKSNDGKSVLFSVRCLKN